MTGFQTKNEMQIAKTLATFIEESALPGTGVDAEMFWKGFSQLIHEYGRENKALLAKRDILQRQIDAWHIERHGQAHDHEQYKAFLLDIGYLVEEGDDFEIDTTNVDPEIATVPGPQLVVPVTNARYALNAANSRWGSLYDGFYGTDAMGSAAPEGGYDQGRGARVVARARFSRPGFSDCRDKPRRCPALYRAQRRFADR